jgi:hypothetical protein
MSQEILGASGFTKGWGEMKFAPGVHAKTGLRFDWGRFNNAISAIEVGANVEFYAKKVEQMVGVEPNQFFLNGYLAVVFGNRK